MVQNRQRLIKTAVHWALLVLTFLYLVSGLGITQYRIVEPLTFGLLSKSLAFRIHEDLSVPFFVLLGSHILFSPALWVYPHLKKIPLILSSSILLSLHGPL